MQRLRDESSIINYSASGKPEAVYHVEFRGKSLARFHGKISVVERHEVEIKLGSSYPRTMPELRWRSPIYHPNISEIGMVCLGGYGTHWVPSLQLDELCTMLWDMLRYHNYDIRSPYNRDAALWVANQTTFRFPIDPRPLRDRRAALGRLESVVLAAVETTAKSSGEGPPSTTTPLPSRVGRFASFLKRGTPVSNGAISEGLIILDDEAETGAESETEPASTPVEVAPPPEEIVFLD